MDSSEDIQYDPDMEYCAYNKKRKSSVKLVRLYKCMLCNDKFLNKGNLDEHKLTHAAIKPFECPHCGYKSSLKDIMKNHMVIQHGIVVNRNDIISSIKFDMVVQEYKCKICNDYFATKKLLHSHHQLNELCKPYACTHCDIKFEKEVIDVKLENLASFEIKDESLSDEDIEGLDTHSPLLLIGDMKKMTIYKCTICSKQFHSKSSLYRHNLSHYGLKPFGCTQCEYRCALRGIMKNHMEVRHGILLKITDIAPDKKDKMFIRAYKCTSCSKILPSKERLQKHLTLNNTCKPFKCMFCDYRSSMRSTMKRHLQGKHGHAIDISAIFEDKPEGVEITEVPSDEIYIEDDIDFKIEIASTEVIPSASTTEDYSEITYIDNSRFADFCIKQEDLDAGRVNILEPKYKIQDCLTTNNLHIKLEFDDLEEPT